MFCVRYQLSFFIQQETMPTYLIKPCLHDFCRLFWKIASLSCFSMLILVMTGHEECRDISRIGVARICVHRLRLLLVVTRTVAMFWVSISDW